MNNKEFKANSKMYVKIFRYAFSVFIKDIFIKLGIFFRLCFNIPYVINIDITNKCTARCATCDRWQIEEESKELSVEEWIYHLDKLTRWIKTDYISFSGGEPFAKNGFDKILKYLSKSNIYIQVDTNGIVFNTEGCENIANTGVDFILFSLNSIDSKLHNQYKGTENLHQKIVEAIKHIKRKNKKVCLGVTLLITKDNYRILSEFAEWVYELGIDSINFQPIRNNLGPIFSPHPSLRADVLNPYYKIDDLKELDRQIDLLIFKKKKGLPIITPINDLKNMKIYFRDPFKMPKKHWCLVGFRNLIISPIGDVKLCYTLPILGNIREKSLKEIWFSKEAQIQRVNMLRCQTPCVLACLRDYTFSEKFINFLIRLGFKHKSKKNQCNKNRSIPGLLISPFLMRTSSLINFTAHCGNVR